MRGENEPQWYRECEYGCNKAILQKSSSGCIRPEIKASCMAGQFRINELKLGGVSHEEAALNGG